MTKFSNTNWQESGSERPEILDVLRTGPVGVSSADEVENAKERMLPWLEDQVAQLPMTRARHQAKVRRKRALGVAGGALLAAAGVTLAVFVSQGLPPGDDTGHQASANQSSRSTEPQEFATLISGKVTSGTLEVLAGSRLGLSSRVTTGKVEGAALVTQGGYQLELAPNSDISFAPPAKDQRGTKTLLHLYGGMAKLAVLPLPQGSSLSVVTRDARVTVVGTAFSVEAHDDSPTCVRVTEGKVVVERAGTSTTVSAGQESGCEASAQTQRASTAALAQARHRKTTLKEENKLLSAALSAERQGKQAQARQAFEQLLRRYPKSSFAQDARAGLNRLEVTAREDE